MRRSRACKYADVEFDSRDFDVEVSAWAETGRSVRCLLKGGLDVDGRVAVDAFSLLAEIGNEEDDALEMDSRSLWNLRFVVLSAVGISRDLYLTDNELWNKRRLKERGAGGAAARPHAKSKAAQIEKQELQPIPS